MTISLIHPSRSRPQKAYETARRWAENSGLELKQIDYILSLDESDPKLKEYWIEWDCEIVGPNNSVVEATNRAAKEAKGDILIYLSDDFQCPDNWGQLVINEFQKYQGPTLIKVDDCLQPFRVKVLTIPMMNRALYRKLGYFWHPEYRSMHVDEDLYHTSEKIGALKFAPHLKFPHIHPANPNPAMRCDNDETYKRSAANWEQGKAVFQRRKAAGFPV